MLDRRRTPRLTARRTVRIELNPRWPTIDCTLRNINKQGAGIELSGEYNTSLEFDMIFFGGNERRRCRQVWRRENRLGVEFADAA
ncbi:MAG: PilZ domain-containing protein [Bradyrhizobiaceae bacterium]|nr:PilZ domain-containing protein [Bradyrhizobiaceae bacterium]